MMQGLVSVAVLVAVLDAAVPPPRRENHNVLDLVKDFMSAYIADARLLTVVGEAPWLSALLRHLSSSASPAVRLLGGADGGDVTHYRGWWASYALVLVDVPDAPLLCRALSRLPPAPLQNDLVAVVCVGCPSSTTRLLLSGVVAKKGLCTQGRPRVAVLDSVGEEGAVTGAVLHAAGIPCWGWTVRRLASWRRGKGFQPPGPIFSDLKRLTLNGCPLRTAYFAVPPTLTVSPSGAGGGLRIGGLAGQVLDIMADAMNTTFVPQNFSYAMESIDGVEMPTQLAKTALGEVDVTVGPITGLADRAKILEWSNLPLRECYVLLVPSRLGNAERSGLRDVAEAFGSSTWILLLAVVVVLAIVLRLVIGAGPGSRMGRALFAAAVVLIGQPRVADLPGGAAARTRIRTRALFGAWMLTALVLSTAFQAKLWSILSKVNRVPLSTLEDILDTGLTVRAPMFIMGDFTTSGNKTMRRFWERARTSPLRRGYANLSQADYIMLMDVTTAAYYGAFDRKDGEEEPGLYSLPGCFASYPMYYFSLDKGSPLLPRLLDLWRRLYTAGVINHIISGEQHTRMVASVQKAHRARRKRPFSVYKLRGSFHILILGLGLALLVFLAEHSLHRCARPSARSPPACPNSAVLSRTRMAALRHQPTLKAISAK